MNGPIMNDSQFLMLRLHIELKTKMSFLLYND